MRIISGELKGKKLSTPLDKSTRPLKDIVRESIFNILDHSVKASKQLQNAKVLDLFSGTGSFGIECLSRGAAKVYFFENYNNSLKILKQNILKFKLENKSLIYNYSAYNLEKSNLESLVFDIIFLDPPFKEKNISLILTKIKEAEILDKKGIIIIHRNFKENELFPELKIVEEKKYGISKILFCKF